MDISITNTKHKETWIFISYLWIAMFNFFFFVLTLNKREDT